MDLASCQRAEDQLRHVQLRYQQVLRGPLSPLARADLFVLVELPESMFFGRKEGLLRK